MEEFHPLCIRTTKLYDWVTRPTTRDITYDDDFFVEQVPPKGLFQSIHVRSLRIQKTLK
ncbi:hypothetical protein [Evansella halocellulosilytica]|uniref:hypothetical protein n=1 Tax=Evansella halocellulosilytica TaxID=2011013 RepID=UPI0015C74124|nr:hypothetical protein [Evansella halocellulosilytica]